MSVGKVIVFNEDITAAKFRESIQKEYKLTWRPAKKENLVLLDSFDGRVYRAGYILRLSNNTLQLLSVAESSIDQTSSWIKTTPPKSAADFKNTNLYEILSPVLGIRSLIPQIKLGLNIREFDIQNRDDKKIARGSFVTAKKDDKPEQLKTFVFLNPIRGYYTEVRGISTQWPGFETHPLFEKALLDVFEIDLTDYSKPVFQFSDDTSMARAFYSILAGSFSIMRKNETGIIEDIDIEFLHDYRVSGRRMRSALGLIKNVLAPEITNQLTSDLKQISNVSGPLRDLDVYLLREQEYKSLLPSEWALNEIHAIFVNLKRRRKTAYRTMSAFLQSEMYIEMMGRWAGFFNNYDQYVINDPPLKETASALILQRYHKVVKKGKKLSVKSPDEAFHKLRIQCKKLRYLLEFFSSLYAQDEINLAIKQLKKIQDNLGDFNDLSVQIDTLNPPLNKALKDSKEKLVQDIAGLIAVLNYKKIMLRQSFKGLFKKFISEKNVALYHHLFGGTD